MCTALCQALKANDTDCIIDELPLWRTPAYMNAACKGCGYSPLFVARSRWATEAVLNAGADVKAFVLVIPNMPLDMLVCQYGRSGRTHISLVSACSVLRHAVWSRNCDKVDFLLSAYPDIHLRPMDVRAQFDGDEDVICCALVQYYYAMNEEGRRLIDLLFKHAVGVPHSYRDRGYRARYNALCYVCCRLLWAVHSADDAVNQKDRENLQADVLNFKAASY